MLTQLSYHVVLVTKSHETHPHERLVVKRKLTVRDNHNNNNHNNPHQESRNNNKIAFVTYSTLKSVDYFRYLIVESLLTWVPPDSKLFVIYSAVWQGKYRNLCANMPPHLPHDLCERRIVPIWVNCTDYHAGVSGCCKQEQGLKQISQRYNNDFGWYWFQDDDVYVRADMAQAFVDTLPSNEVLILTSGGLLSSAPPLGQSGFLQSPLYHCSRRHDYTYPWGLPVVYSKAALRYTTQHVFAKDGLVQECRAFAVTHDVGNAIVHWMLGLPEIRIGVADRRFRFHAYHQDDDQIMAMHGILALPNATQSLKKYHTMAETHQYYSSQRNWTLAHPIRWHNVSGFQRTKTFQQHGDPSTWNEWVLFPPEDCGDNDEEDSGSMSQTSRSS